MEPYANAIRNNSYDLGPSSHPVWRAQSSHILIHSMILAHPLILVWRAESSHILVQNPDLGPSSHPRVASGVEPHLGSKKSPIQMDRASYVYVFCLLTKRAYSFSTCI